jgi:hypothetical protein
VQTRNPGNWEDAMLAIDGDRLLILVNSDPEFRSSARHWTGTFGLGLGSSTLLLTFRDGALVAAAPGDVSSASIRMSVSEQDWREFFRPIPKPFYQGMLPAVARQGFALDGDIEAWTVYYGALSRVFACMRQATTE